MTRRGEARQLALGFELAGQEQTAPHEADPWAEASTGERQQSARAKPDGDALGRARDAARRFTQRRAVFELMSDGCERTLYEIAQHVVGAHTGLAARLRDLRRLGYRVESRRVGQGGTWTYRLVGRGA